MKRILILLIAALLVGSLAACNKKGTDGVEGGDNGTLGDSTEEYVIEVDERVETPIAPTVTEEQKKFIPEGATVLATSSDALNLTMEGELGEVKEFYKKVIKDLGVTGEEKTVTPSVDSEIPIEAWTFEGTYADGKDFSIILQAMSGQVSIIVMY